MQKAALLLLVNLLIYSAAEPCLHIVLDGFVVLLHIHKTTLAHLTLQLVTIRSYKQSYSLYSHNKL